MDRIELDGRAWKSEADFFDRLANALGCHDGHGRNWDALLETMIYYTWLQSVVPPYEVVIANASEAVRPFLLRFANSVARDRKDRLDDPEWGDDVDVKVIVE